MDILIILTALMIILNLICAGTAFYVFKKYKKPKCEELTPEQKRKMREEKLALEYLMSYIGDSQDDLD